MAVPTPGWFITVEGLDGAGKSTQFEYLQRWLVRGGYPVVTAREPGGTAVGEDIRKVLLETRGHMHPVTEAFLYAGARAQLVAQVIEPALARGQLVLSDRFLDSSIAYQGYGRELGLEKVEAINAPAVGNVRPQLTLYLDLPVEEALRRKHGRENAPDRMESEEVAFFQRVRRGYLDLAWREPERVKIVSATGTAVAVWERLRRQVAGLLKWGG